MHAQSKIRFLREVDQELTKGNTFRSDGCGLPLIWFENGKLVSFERLTEPTSRAIFSNRLADNKGPNNEELIHPPKEKIVTPNEPIAVLRRAILSRRVRLSRVPGGLP